MISMSALGAIMTSPFVSTLKNKIGAKNVIILAFVITILSTIMLGLIARF